MKEAQKKIYRAKKAYSEAASAMLKKNLDFMAGCLDTARAETVEKKLAACRNMDIYLKDTGRARAADVLCRVLEEKSGDIFIFYDFWYQNRVPYALFVPDDNLYICCTESIKKGRFTLNMHGLYNRRKLQCGQRKPEFWLSKAKLFKEKYLSEKVQKSD